MMNSEYEYNIRGKQIEVTSLIDNDIIKINIITSAT